MESSSSYSADSHHLTPPPSNIIDDVFLLPDHLYLALSGDHHHQNNFPPHTFAQHTAHSSHFPQSQSQSQLWNHHHHHTHTSAGTGTGTEDSGGKDSAGFTTPMFLTQSPHPQANSHPFAFNPPSNGNPAGPHLQVQPSRCLHDDPPPAMIHTGSSPYTTGITPTGSRPTTFEFDSAPSNQQYQHHHHQPAQPQAIGVPSTAGSATTADLHGSFFSNFSPSMSSSSPYAYAHSPSQHTTSSSSMGAGASAMGIGPGTSFGGGIGAGGGGVGGLGGGGSGGGGIDFGAGGSTPATSIFSLASSVPQSYSNHGHAPPASMQHPHLMAEAGSPTAALAMLDRRGSGTHAAAVAVGGGGSGQYTDQSMSGVSTSVPPSFHFGLHHAASMQAMAEHTVAAEGEGGMNFDPMCPSSSVVSAGSMGRQQQQQHRRHRSSTSASPVAARRLKDRSLSRNRAVTGASTLGKRASPAIDQVEGGEIEEDQHGCDGGGAEGKSAGGVGKAPSTRSRAVRRASIGPAAARAVGGVRGRSGSISHRGNGSVPSSHPHQGSSGAEEAQAHQSPSMNGQVGMYNNSPPSPSISFFQSFGHHPSQHQLLHHHHQGGMDSSNASSAQDSPMSSSQQSQSAAAGGCMLGGSGPGSAHSGMFEMGSFPYQHQQQFRSSQSQSQSPASSAGGGGGGEAGPAGATPSCSSTTTSSTAYLRHHHHYHHPSASGNAVSLSSVVEEGAGSSSMQGVVKREEVDVRDDDDDDDDDDNDEGEGEAFEYDAAGDDGDEDFVDEDQEQDGDAQAKGGEKKKKNSNVSNGRKKGGSGVNEEDDEQGAEPSNKTRSAGTTTKAKATTGKKAVAVGGGKRVTIASKAKGGASLVNGDAQAGGGEGNREAGDGDTTITKAATTGKVVGATAKKGRAGAKEKDPEAEAKRLAERRRRRRESHNAVERRRRDTINEKITELATLLPEAMLVEAIASSTSGGNSGAFDIAAAVKTLSGVEEEGERERRETEKEILEEEVNESGGLGVYSLPPLLSELVGGVAEREDDGQGSGYHAAKAGTMMSPQTALAGLPFLSISGGGDNKQIGGGEGMNVLNGFGSFSSNGVVNGGGIVGGYGGPMSSFQTQGLQAPVGMNTAIPRHILNWATSASAAHAHHAASGSNNPAFKNDLAGPSSSSSAGMGPLNPTLVYAAALAPVHRDSAALAAAQAKPNKGIILRKSVDYIRHLQQFLDMQMGINQALEAEVQALRSLVGEACDAGRGRATTTLTNDLMHDSAMANASSTMPNHMAGTGGGQQSGYQQVRSQPLTKLGSNQSRSPPKSQVTALFGGSEGGVSVPPALTSLVDSLRDVPAPTSSHTLGNNVVVLANPGPGLGSNGITHSGRRASPPPSLPPQASPENVGSMTGATTVGSVDGTNGLQPWMGVEYDSRTGLPRRPSPEPESIAGAAAVGKQQQQQHQQQSQQADGRVFSPASASSLMRGAAMSIQAQGQSGFLSPTFSPAGSGATAAFMMHSGGGNLRSTHHHAHGQQQHGGYGQRHGHLSVNTNGQNRNFPNASAGGVEIERGRSRTRSFHPSMSSANNSEGSWPELKASAALSRATSEERLPSARMTPAGFGSQSRVASLGRVASPTSPTSPVLGGAASRHHGGGAGGMHHGFVGLGLDEFFAHLGGVGGGVAGLGTESHSSLTGGGGGGGGGNGLVAMEE